MPSVAWHGAHASCVTVVQHQRREAEREVKTLRAAGRTTAVRHATGRAPRRAGVDGVELTVVFPAAAVAVAPANH